MKSIITGLNGTVAPALAHSLKTAGHTVIRWDRTVVPTDSASATEAFLRAEQPQAVFHLATGSADWATWLAQACAEQKIKFLFTSSVSVFSGTQQGPFTVNDLPRPEDDYGRYKLDCEQRIRAANPQALIIRLGWQIGRQPGGNQMVDFLQHTFERDGVIQASTNWFQACSFLEDTADGLAWAMQELEGGLYHLDGNPGLDFYEIASGLNRLLGQPWQVQPGETPALNNRLLDARLPTRPLTEWF